jgi:hypothetical protein
MTRIADRRTILAIDPTTRGLAYAVFEKGLLADWGQPECRRGEGAVLLGLLERLDVALLVLEDPDAPGAQRRPRVKALLRNLARRGEKFGVRVRKVARGKVRESWRNLGVTNKQAMAARLGAAFPELRAFVPPPRKTFMTEDLRVKLFDVLSLLLEAVDVAPEEIAP